MYKCRLLEQTSPTCAFYNTFAEGCLELCTVNALKNQMDCRVLSIVSTAWLDGKSVNLLACAKLARRPVGCGCNFLTPNLISGAPVFCGTKGEGVCCGIGGTGGKLLLPNPLEGANPVG